MRLFFAYTGNPTLGSPKWCSSFNPLHDVKNVDGREKVRRITNEADDGLGLMISPKFLVNTLSFSFSPRHLIIFARQDYSGITV